MMEAATSKPSGLSFTLRRTNAGNGSRSPATTAAPTVTTTTPTSPCRRRARPGPAAVAGDLRRQPPHPRGGRAVQVLDGFVVLAPTCSGARRRASSWAIPAPSANVRCNCSRRPTAKLAADLATSLAALRARPECASRVGAIGYRITGRPARLPGGGRRRHRCAELLLRRRHRGPARIRAAHRPP